MLSSPAFQTVILSLSSSVDFQGQRPIGGQQGGSNIARNGELERITLLIRRVCTMHKSYSNVFRHVRGRWFVMVLASISIFVLRA